MCLMLTHGIYMEVYVKKTVLVSSREMKTRNRNLDIKFIKTQDEAMRVTTISRRGQEENQREKFGVQSA